MGGYATRLRDLETFFQKIQNFYFWPKNWRFFVIFSIFSYFWRHFLPYRALMKFLVLKVSFWPILQPKSDLRCGKLRDKLENRGQNWPTKPKIMDFQKWWFFRPPRGQISWPITSLESTSHKLSIGGSWSYPINPRDGITLTLFYILNPMF